MNASCCIRIPRINDDCARETLRRNFPTDFHRRGANLIFCEHSCDGGRNVGNDQRQVVFAAFLRTFASPESFYVAKNRGAFESARRANGAMKDLLQITKLETIFPTFEDEQKAIQSYGTGASA